MAMMNESTTAVPGKTFDEKTVKYIVSLFQEGRDSSFIVSNLVENGYDYDQSYNIVAAIHQKLVTAQTKREKKNGPLNLILGLVILIAGIAVTASGVGVIAYGAIIVGALKTIQGLADVLS